MAFIFCDPVGTRTQGPYIKSVLLYQLSYEINRMFSRTGRKDMYILFFAKSFTSFFRENPCEPLQYWLYKHVNYNYLKVHNQFYVQQP